MEVIIVKNYDELSLKAASIIKGVVLSKNNAVLGLATGSTPIGTYKNLIKWHKEEGIDFSKVTTINLDEYVGLPITHHESYRYFMNDNLFNHINIDKNNTYVPNGLASDIEVECKRYDKLIEEKGPIDVQLLGIGENGHIGFNEPCEYFPEGTHSVTLTESTRNANKRFFDNNIDNVPKQAITMGLKAIVNAKMPLLIANGKNKTDAIYGLVKGKVSSNLPASILRLNNNSVIIVDEEAASKIK